MPIKKQFYGTSIYRGILTGYNDAFIVNTATREHLIAEDSASKEILKPVFRGRDIERYRANWVDRWLIATLPSLDINIDVYPAVKRHLLSFGKERLAQEGRVLSEGGQDLGKRPPTLGTNFRILALTMKNLCVTKLFGKEQIQH